MSTHQRTYLGFYFKLPNKNEDWYDLADKLNFNPDEFSRMPYREDICYSNYSATNGYQLDLDNQLLHVDETFTKECKELFLKHHSATIEKLRKHFNQDITLQFGLIGCTY